MIVYTVVDFEDETVRPQPQRGDSLMARYRKDWSAQMHCSCGDTSKADTSKWTTEIRKLV
jgi:hypothetical protein